MPPSRDLLREAKHGDAHSEGYSALAQTPTTTAVLRWPSDVDTQLHEFFEVPLDDFQNCGYSEPRPMTFEDRTTQPSVGTSLNSGQSEDAAAAVRHLYNQDSMSRVRRSSLDSLSLSSLENNDWPGDYSTGASARLHSGSLYESADTAASSTKNRSCCQLSPGVKRGLGRTGEATLSAGGAVLCALCYATVAFCG